MVYTIDELKALKYQPVFDFYAKCDVPFKNTRDLTDYHEKCVRWDSDKQWPNIGNMLNMDNRSPEAIAFNKMYKKLLKNRGDGLTLNIKYRGHKKSPPGKSWYEYIPAPSYQDVFAFYANRDIRFKTLKELWDYHEGERWEPLDGGRQCGSAKQWPTLGELANAYNYSDEAVAFMQMFEKLKAKDPHRYAHIRCTDRAEVEHLEYVNSLSTNKQQPAFDFYSKCTVPFETYGDLKEYHNKCVRYDADKEFTCIGNIFQTTNKSPEAVAFREMYVRLKKRGKHVTLTFRELNPRVPGKSWFEYNHNIHNLSAHEVVYQKVFEFFAKCTVPFKTLNDVSTYYERCVEFVKGREKEWWPSFDRVLCVEDIDTPESVAFHKIIEKFGNFRVDPNDPDPPETRLTLTFRKCDPKTPGNSYYEYVPEIPLPELKTLRQDPRGSFTKEIKGVATNVKPTIPLKKKYVYLITCTNQGLVKVGRHSGPIKELHGRYRTCAGRYELTDIFECNDYVNIEKAIHQVLTAYGFHDHLEFFADVPQVREIWNTFKEMNVRMA